MSSRVLILRGFGFNCEEETAAAYIEAAAQPQVVHVADWLNGSIRLDDYDVFHVPGGFSYGDVLGSGQVFANRVRAAVFGEGGSLWDNLLAFLERGGRVIGICNGFQALTRLGLLPNLAGNYAQEVGLAPNRSGRFEDRWVRCAVPAAHQAQFGSAVFELPVRHGEGRMLFASRHVREEVMRLGLAALQYAEESGQPTSEYPANPNGSELQCAALFSKDRQVFGMMPHPEAYVSAYNHPAWPIRKRRGTLPAYGGGVSLLRALLRPTAVAAQTPVTGATQTNPEARHG